MNIKNFTANTLFLFYAEDTVLNKEMGKVVLKDGAEPIAMLKPEGYVPRAKFKEISPVTVGDWPISSKEVESYDPLPEGDYDYAVVNAIYAAAVPNDYRGRLVTVGSETVFDSTGKTVVGCTGLSRV